MNTDADGRWLVQYDRRPDAAVRLLCLPRAGSSAAAYAGWSARLPPQIDMRVAEYPGHGARRAEPPLVRVRSIVAEMLPVVQRVSMPPFAVFGDCLGALIGFELVRLILRHRGTPPVALLVAGSRGPSLRQRKAPIHALPDDEFVTALRSVEAVPEDVANLPHFRDVFLPTLRSDFEMADTYIYRPLSTVLECPLVAYGGREDTEALPDELKAWAAETRGCFRARFYDGDHRFLRTCEQAVLHDIAEDLALASAPWQPTDRPCAQV